MLEARLAYARFRRTPTVLLYYWPLLRMSVRAAAAASYRALSGVHGYVQGSLIFVFWFVISVIAAYVQG
jgi:hypothetical protein